MKSVPGVRLRAAFLFLSAALSLPAFAQWPTARDENAPRSADGKINLAGPAPALAGDRVDLSGIWQVDDNHLQFNMMADGPQVPLTSAAEAIYQKRLAGAGKDRPSGKCMPHGIPDAMIVPSPFKFIHTAQFTLVLYEEFVDFRQIFTDGRALPKAPEPAWFGYSVGRWERDSFVIETSGFNDKSWLDDDGHPHSEALKTTERFRRPDYGHMTMEIIIDDPKSYARPWNATFHFHLLPETEFIEYICDNEQDQKHMVGQ
ncbi:MAG: hypothetical protein ABL967_05505 [Bryobacteraceae bacterium]